MTATISNKRNSGWAMFVSVVLWIFTSLSALGLIIASFGGNLSPTEYRGICIMVMVLPIWCIAMLLFTVLDLFWCRKALWISLFTFVVCAPAIWNYSPLNIVNTNATKYKGYPTFTLLTYNVANFVNCDTTVTPSRNETISYILNTDADVVCIQEAMMLREFKSPKYMILQEQVDSLYQAYPYIILHGTSQMLLSKYPVESLPTSNSKSNVDKIAAFRLNIQGAPITLFNLHLQSYSLSKSDKSLYQDITDVKSEQHQIKSELLSIKSQLLSKIQRAAELRELDAERLGQYVQHYAGDNAIIAGDFNDVPGCYTLQRMADFSFNQVYSKVGFGPMHTFHADRFYFRIDHVLYRGNLEPILMWRGNVKSSDHYPLFTAFALTSD